MSVSQEYLTELRELWEGDREVVAALDKPSRYFLVVTKESDRTYNCFRYFQAGFDEDRRWEVSVDGRAVPADTAIKWLTNPSARVCRIGLEGQAEEPDVKELAERNEKLLKQVNSTITFLRGLLTSNGVDNEMYRVIYHQIRDLEEAVL